MSQALLDHALKNDNENEAIAALRKLRKKGIQATVGTPDKETLNGMTVEELYGYAHKLNKRVLEQNTLIKNLLDNSKNKDRYMNKISREIEALRTSTGFQNFEIKRLRRKNFLLSIILVFSSTFFISTILSGVLL